MKRSLVFGLVLVLTSWSLLAPSPSLAGLNGLGDLNRSFGGDGVATFNRGGLVTPTVDGGYAIAVQPDGKVLVAGQSTDNGGAFSTFLILRYLPNGALDPTFSADGMLQVGFGTAFARATGVAVDSQGRVLVGGTASDVNDFDAPSARFAITRINSNGVVDATFGNNGRTIHSFAAAGSPGAAESRALGMSSGDRPIMVGQVTESGGNQRTGLATARYKTDGSLDNTYSGDGMTLRYYADTTLVGTSVAIGWGYEVFVSAQAVIDGTPYVGLLKLTANGASADGISDLTPGFRLYGVEGASPYPTSVVVQDGGRARVIIGAISWQQGIARLNLIGVNQHTGDEDPSFGTNARTSIPSDDVLSSLALTSGDRIVATGYTAGNAANQFIAMFSADGSIYQDFGLGGYRELSGVPTPNQGRAVAVGPGNAIYTTGTVNLPVPSVLTTSRYGQPQAVPGSPRVTRLVRSGNNVVAHFVRAAGGVAPLGYRYRLRMVNRAGVARPFGQWIPAEALRVNVPTTARLPNFELHIQALGQFGSGPSSVSRWQTTHRGNSNCPVLIPNRLVFEPNSNVRVVFPRRTSGCASWRLGNQGRFRTLPTGATQLRTPRVPANASRQLIIRRGSARTVIALRTS